MGQQPFVPAQSAMLSTAELLHPGESSSDDRLSLRIKTISFYGCTRVLIYDDRHIQNPFKTKLYITTKTNHNNKRTTTNFKRRHFVCKISLTAMVAYVDGDKEKFNSMLLSPHSLVTSFHVRSFTNSTTFLYDPDILFSLSFFE